MKDILYQNIVFLSRNTNGGFSIDSILKMDIEDFNLYLNSTINLIKQENKSNTTT